MAELTDRQVEALLRATLHAEVAAMPVGLDPSDVVARARSRRRARPARWIRSLVPVAALLLLGGLLAVVSQPRTDPDGAAYAAVLVRGLEAAPDGSGVTDLEVVLAFPDGSVRPQLSIPASRFPGLVGVGAPKLSATGWLAFDVARQDDRHEGQVLVDLRDPDREPAVLDGSALLGWAPDGTLWRSPNGPFQHIDPVSGRVTEIPVEVAGDLLAWVFGGWRLPIAADGSGMVVQEVVPAYDGSGRPMTRRWAVVAPDGRLVPGTPVLTEDLGPRLLSPRWGLLTVCDTDPATHAHCPHHDRGTVTSGPAGDGTHRAWGPPPPPHEFVLDASWAADEGVWRLLDRRVGGRTLHLAHRDAAGADTPRAAFATSAEGGVTIDGIAPDDSMVAVGWVDDDAWWTALADPRSGRAHLHEGQVAGFVPPEAAAAWHGEPFPVEPGRLLPASPEPGVTGSWYPALPTLDEQVLGLERVLLVHEAAPASAPVEVELGPIELDVGYGFVVVCSGPGDVAYTVIGDSGPESPVVMHCQDGQPGSQGAPGATDRSIRVIVTADPATAWRLVVHDPAPRPPRRP